MKEKVAVIFGSMSSEHKISCLSASNVIRYLDINKYEVTPIGIDKNGTWTRYTGPINSIKEGYWSGDLLNNIIIKDIIGELKKYDVIFPVLHGRYGEDGSIQGLLELAQVKYVGCKVLGSSIAIDKILSKKLVKAENIDIVPYTSLTHNKYYNKDFNRSAFARKISEMLKYPVIVKPNREGSSYGLAKVDSEEDLFNAIEYSLRYDTKILIEKYISNKKEIECALLEDKANDLIYVANPGEVISSGGLYDFNAKYKNRGAYLQIPAKLYKEQVDKIKKYSEKIFKALRLDGIARIDFFVTENKIYFNEVNTMPGFTDKSMYPKLFEYEGIQYNNILDILIDSAKE